MIMTEKRSVVVLTHPTKCSDTVMCDVLVVNRPDWHSTVIRILSFVILLALVVGIHV